MGVSNDIFKNVYIEYLCANILDVFILRMCLIEMRQRDVATWQMDFYNKDNLLKPRDFLISRCDFTLFQVVFACCCS